ncbi:hypothetical protein DOTSEDRAFT_26984 [Dothistroma septosporum NZE10]|uniref:Uncharacterized protein n=1 Tax=Dothistroma septosporum (strain NZE10 / CBS 128990) TaxID=675120 RepID=N1PJY6_DOTSN|nr:hypothetical protein DOTSEDRAFT_26984 [Dothistroma septosporum NZE10]
MIVSELKAASKAHEAGNVSRHRNNSAKQIPRLTTARGGEDLTVVEGTAKAKAEQEASKDMGPRTKDCATYGGIGDGSEVVLDGNQSLSASMRVEDTCAYL